MILFDVCFLAVEPIIEHTDLIALSAMKVGFHFVYHNVAE